jgi:MFS family permease
MTRAREGVITGCLLGLASGWNVGNVGAVASDLADAYAVSLVVIGLFTTALYVSHTMIQIPGGRASDRFGAARTGMAALGFIAVGNVLALIAPEAWLLLLARAVTGFGTGLTFIAGSALVRQSGGSPFAQGLFGGIGLGAGGLALALVPFASGALGWRAPFGTALAVSLFVLPFVWRVAARHPAATVPAAAATTARRGQRLLRDPQVRRMAFLYTSSYGLSVVLGNWAVEFLQRHSSMPDRAAGATAAITLALVIVTRPLGGWILRRHPRHIRASVGASLAAGAAGTAALLAAQPAWLALTGAVLVGIGAGISFSPAFTGAADSRPDAPAAAVGVVNTVANCFVLAGTPLLGLTFSLPGEGRLGFAIVGVLWLVALVLLPGRAAFIPRAPARAPTPAPARV